DPATTEISTLSLHDALPISPALFTTISRWPKVSSAACTRLSAWAWMATLACTPTVSPPAARTACTVSSRVHLFQSPSTVWAPSRSEEHTSELQSRENLVCRL